MTNPTGASLKEDRFRDAIREKVCRVCLDQRDDGSCGLRTRMCAIERHLPQLGAVLARVDSSRMDDYEEAVRAEICHGCPQEDAAGSCALRESAECALFVYLPLVLDAIESVTAEESEA